MAAEKIELFEIDVDYSSVLDEQVELLKSMDALKKSQQEYNKAVKAGEDLTDEQTKAYVENGNALKTQQKQYTQNNKVLQANNDIKVENINTIEDARKALSSTSVLWARTTKLEGENSESSKKLSAKKLELTNRLKELERGTGDATRNVGNYTESMNAAAVSTAGLPGPLGKTAGGIIGMTTAAKAFLATPLGLALAVITGLLLAVKTAFTSSEEGQNKYNKLMGVLGALLGNLLDLVADFGEAIISVFENPKQALQDFAKLIKDNIVNRFVGLVELVPQLGKAIKLLFEGDFGEAGKVAVNALTKVSLGVDDITGKIEKAAEATSEFLKEQEREAKLAAQVADARAKADKIERSLLVTRSKIEAEVAELRLKGREEDKFSAEQRKAFLIEARGLQDNLLTKEKEVLQLRADAFTTENKFARSTKENLDNEAKAIAAVAAVETTRLNAARQVQRELNTLSKQAATADKVRLKATTATLQQDLALFEANNQTKLKKGEEVNKAIIDQETERLATIRDKNIEIQNNLFNTGELNQTEHNTALLNIQNNYSQQVVVINNFLLKQQEETLAKEVENEKKAADEKTALRLEREQADLEASRFIAEENAITAQAFQREQLDIAYAAELEAADRTGADVALIDEKYRLATKRADLIATQSKLGLAADFANNLAGIFGKQTKAGKAASAAAATISALQAANGAYASLSSIPYVGPVLGAAAAGAALAAGYRNVKKIYAVDSGLPGDGGGGGGVPGGGSGFGGGNSLVTPRIADGGLTSRGARDSSRAISDGIIDGLKGIPQQVLVVDDVTAAQIDQSNLVLQSKI